MRTALLAAAASLLLAAPALAAPPYVGWESFGTADGYAEVYVRPEPAGSHPRIGVRLLRNMAVMLSALLRRTNKELDRLSRVSS